MKAWSKLQTVDPNRYEELVEQAERHEIDINHQEYISLLDIIHDEQQLLSLAEMKIIYAFKNLEIELLYCLRLKEFGF